MTRDVILTLSLLLVAGLFARLLATLLHVPEIVFLLAIGVFLLSFLHADSGYWWLVPGMCVLGIGVGLFYSSVTTAAVTTLDPARASLAGGVVYMCQIAGGAIGLGINTAIVLAQKGVRVLLIDADLRRPSVHKTLGMGPRSGLSNVLTGSATLEHTITRSPILSNLFILPAGTPPPNPAELLASSNMRDLLTDLREKYDHIIIDTPPTLGLITVNALVAASHVLIPIQSSYFALEGTDDLLETIEKVKARPNPNS